MRSVYLLWSLVGLVACATAVPSRIIGGDVTTISQYPHIVSVITSWYMNNFMQSCGGTIINTRSILSAAHCTHFLTPAMMRVRVGSTYANSGGTVHSISSYINHPRQHVLVHADSDITILRTASAITYVNNAVQPGTFAGPNYDAGDNALVWAAGWGFTTNDGPPSEQLRHVQMWTVNREVCQERYLTGWFPQVITENMLCAGWLDVGGRGQCTQDSGSPLYHNGVVVGVCSFGEGCASPTYPGVNVRVSRFIEWIQANA